MISTTAAATKTLFRRSLGALSSAGSAMGAPTGLPRRPQVFGPATTIGAWRSLFIQTADTPNPESLKFIPGITIFDNEDGNGYYVTRNEASSSDLHKSPLAKNLLTVDGVKAVYLGADFVTITKYAEHKWKLMKPRLFETLMNWAETGQPAVLDQPLVTDTTILDDDDEVVAMIKELMEARIRPAVQEDGGDIRYVGFDEDTGLVTVQLAGSCVGCPSSAVTLKQGVENMLMHYIPEVTGVEALEEEDEEGGGGSATEDGEDASSFAASDKDSTKQRSYEERLAKAGIPFSD